MTIAGNVSLLDASKNMPDSPMSAVMLTYALTTHPLMAMPIETKPTGIKKWKVVNDLPYDSSAYAYRNIEGEYTITKTPTQPMSSNVRIAGGRVKIDRAIKKLSPEDVNIQRVGQIQARANQLTKDIFEGTGGSYLWGISGQIDSIPYLSGQYVDMGSASAGAVIAEDKLDEFLAKINIIPGRTFIYGNDAPTRRIKKLSRGQGTTASGSYIYNVSYRPEEFGTFAGTYDNIPIVTLKDGKGTDLLSNTEGDGASTTLYVVTYGPEAFTGFQQSPPDVYTLGDISVYEATDIEWMLGTAATSVRCVAKMRYVKNDVA